MLADSPMGQFRGFLVETDECKPFCKQVACGMIVCWCEWSAWCVWAVGGALLVCVCMGVHGGVWGFLPSGGRGLWRG